MAAIMLDMHQCCCFTCGVAFCVPADLFEFYIQDHREYFCPNGHGQVVSPEEPEQPAPKREELIQALHRAEQAEAKASELAEQRQPEEPKRRQRQKAGE